MARKQAETLWLHLRSLVAAETSGLADHELIERFAQQHDEAAFEALVRRHGPMVLRVCRGVLGDAQLSEDAFQATFLVLVRKISAIRKHTSVASWLYKVAYRVALRARGAVAQRRRHELQAPSRSAADPLGGVLWRDLRAVFDEELQRLPEKYQAPVVLCCLEGLARDEAAQQLGWSAGTLKGRLERGREVLRNRLVRRGVALSAGLGAALLSERAVKAAIPAALSETTVRSAVEFSSGGEGATANISVQVSNLVHGVSRAITVTKLKIAAALLLVVGLFAAAGGTVAHQVLTAADPVMPPANEASPKAKDPAPQPAQTAAAPLDRYGDPLPADAVARLGTIRFRHMHTISAVAYSSDGKKVLSGSWDNTVRLWDAATGKELCRLTGSKDGYTSVAISPDGSLIAGGDMHRTLYLWDATTGKELHRVEKLENTVFGLKFAPDGKTLAGLSGDTVHVWDAATAKEVRQIKGPKEDMRPFTISADLKTFAAGLDDGSVHLWDLNTEKETRQFSSGHGRLTCLAISADGKMLASGGGKDDCNVRLFDSATGRQLQQFGPYTGWIDSLAIAPDGKTLAVGEPSGTIYVNDLSTGKERYRCGLLEGSWVRGLVFSPDGKTLAAGGTDDRVVHFFDAATGKERNLFDGHQNEIVAAVPTRDGKSLMSAGKDGAICVWDLGMGKEIHHWKNNRRGIAAVAVAPDRKSVAIASDKSLTLWDTAMQKEIRQFQGHKGTPSAVAFSPDGKTLASGTWEDHMIRLWDVATGKENRQIQLPKPNGDNYGDVPLVFADGGKLLISGSADRVNPCFYFWDTATGKQLRQIKYPISHLALSPDGTLLATTGDRHIRLWNVATGEQQADIPADAAALAFSPDGRMLAYGGTKGVIHLWDVLTGQERHQFAGHQSGCDERGTFASGVAVLTFTADGRTLISGGGDTTLLLWDVFGTRRHTQDSRTPKALAELWTDLTGDAAKAHDAAGALIAASGEAVSVLKDKVHAVQPCAPQRLARLLADLDSDEFAVRERAAHDLEKMKDSAASGLRKALATNPSGETRRRLQDLLQQVENRPTGETLAALRAVEVLEHIATPEAVDVLRRLAKGARDARLTKAAQRTVERLTVDRAPAP